MLNENIAMVTEDCLVTLESVHGRSASRRFSTILLNAEIYGKKKLTKDEILERYRKFCQSLEIEKRCN